MGQPTDMFMVQHKSLATVFAFTAMCLHGAAAQKCRCGSGFNTVSINRPYCGKCLTKQQAPQPQRGASTYQAPRGQANRLTTRMHIQAPKPQQGVAPCPDYCTKDVCRFPLTGPLSNGSVRGGYCSHRCRLTDKYCVTCQKKGVFQLCAEQQDRNRNCKRHNPSGWKMYYEECSGCTGRY